MSLENDDERSRDETDLRKYAAKVRELNNALLTIAERFVGTIPEDLEQLNELLEKEFGPDLWKRIDKDVKGTSEEKG